MLDSPSFNIHFVGKAGIEYDFTTDAFSISLVCMSYWGENWKSFSLSIVYCSKAESWNTTCWFAHYNLINVGISTNNGIMAYQEKNAVSHTLFM